MKLSEINPYVRYAAHAPYAPFGSKNTKCAKDCRFILVESGKLAAEFLGEILPLASGCALYVPSGFPYKLYAETQTEAFFVNFDFTADFSDCTLPSKPFNFAESKDTEYFPIPTFSDTDVFSKPFVISVTDEMRRELSLIVSEFSGRKIFYGDCCSASMKLLLTLAARAVETTDTSGTGERITDSVIKYVGEHLADPSLDNRAIALALNYHPYYICSLMTKFTGIPLHRYIMSRRISLACEMLLDTELSVGEISELCGFANQAHFSAAFKRIVGRSPAEYRKKGGERS